MTGFRSPAIDRAQAARDAANRQPEPRDLSSLTPDDFGTLDTTDRARLYRDDPDAYRRLRDAA